MNKLLLLALCFLLLGAAPSRKYNYEYGKPWKSNEVNENESALYRYLADGVDTYKDATIVNDDIANGANIQSEKLNLEAISGVVRFSSGKFVLPTKKEQPKTCSPGEMYLNPTIPAIEVCVSENIWKTL